MSHQVPVPRHLLETTGALWVNRLEEVKQRYKVLHRLISDKREGRVSSLNMVE